ncbi:Ribonuclease 3 [subsurface metagenome]
MILSNLEKILNVNFKNKSLLRTALTHRSYLNEHPEYKGESNERLEFLGDAVLEFIASNHLFKSFPKLPEGRLTVFRSAVVSTKTLARIAKNLKLGQFLRLAKGEEKGGGRNNPTLLANTVEAVIGAIFSDCGLKPAQNFVEKHILTLLPQIIKSGAYKDSKSELQELVQEKFKVPPIYKVIKEEGPDHAKIFTVAVLINDKKLEQGKGLSKQEAEEEAAKKALEKIK